MPFAVAVGGIEKLVKVNITFGCLSFNSTFASTPSRMSEDETAKLWKVNRTIHELVKDRVRDYGRSRLGAFLTLHGEGLPSLR